MSQRSSMTMKPADPNDDPAGGGGSLDRQARHGAAAAARSSRPRPAFAQRIVTSGRRTPIDGRVTRAGVIARQLDRSAAYGLKSPRRRTVARLGAGWKDPKARRPRRGIRARAVGVTKRARGRAADLAAMLCCMSPIVPGRRRFASGR